MSTPTRPNSYASGQTIEAAQVNADLDTLYTWIRDSGIHRDGTNAFTALPEGPAATPTGLYQLANKKYVDDQNLNQVKTTDAVLTNDRIRTIDGTQTTPAHSFQGRTGSGMYWASGVCFAVDGANILQFRSGDGQIIFNQHTTFNDPMWVPGMTVTSAGGNIVKRNSGAGYELYADSSMRETKTRIRVDGTGDEYVGKLLATELPTWDALVVNADGTKQPADPDRTEHGRGTAWDRVGPIVEDMVEVFPEGVLTDENGKPVGVDDALVLRTLWHGFKRLVEELAADGFIAEDWVV